MAGDRIHHQNISGISAQNYSQVFAGSAQNVYFTDPKSLQESAGKAVLDCRNALFLTDPHIDRESLITAKGTRVPGTCEWVKNDATYRTWLTCDGDDNGENHNNSRLLWIAGGPGKGKTMLSIFLTEELEKHIVHTGNSDLLFFFCSAQDEKRNTAPAVLRGLLHQIIGKRPQLIKYALPYFEPLERVAQTISSLEALWIIFRTMVSDTEFGTMFCVLDGLDECEESTRRALVSRLVGLLKSPITSNQSLLKLAIISRDIHGLQDCPRIQLDPDNDKKVISDIEQFVSARVKELSQIKGFRDDPQRLLHVQKELLTRAEGTFLWVGFAMDELLRKRTWTEILYSLKKLPIGLPEIYSRMLLGIPDEHRKMSRLILCWVTLAVRPLQLGELAAATNIQSSSWPRTTRMQAILDAISHCGPLLQVHKHQISLIHQSARDYLLREKQDKNKVLEEFRIEPKKAHLELLRTCINCMNQSGLQHSANALDNEVSSRGSPLLAYAALHWPEHAKTCSARDVALSDTLKQFFHEESIVRRNWWAAYHQRIWTTSLPNLPLLHMQCYLGLLPLVEEAVALDKWKPRFLKRTQKTDGQGNTALHLAVQTRNRDLAQVLIDNGAEVNARTMAKQTPLHLASRQENVEILQLLLSREADVNGKGIFGETALQIAVSRNNEVIVQLLLDAGADVNEKGMFMYTMLYDAILSGNEMILRLLLDRGADLNLEDRGGQAALHFAVIFDRVEAVRLLLDKGADMNAKDYKGRTALQLATECGRGVLVQLLKQEESKEKSGRICRDSR